MCNWMHLGRKWLALILGYIVWSDRWCTNQTTCNYRKRHRLRSLNLLWCWAMRHLTAIPWLSLVMFRALPTYHNRSRRHNRDTKTELERVAVYLLITAARRVSLTRSAIMRHLLCTCSIHIHIYRCFSAETAVLL